jgi:hypothetical protein
MNKKEYLILGSICISTLVFFLKVKQEILIITLMVGVCLLFLLFFFQKKWVLKLTKALLTVHVFTTTFMTFIITLYYFFPKEPQLYQVQNYGGTRTLAALVLSLMFSLFFVWENRTNGERKTILIYIGGIALCLLPSLLKQIV